MRKIFETKSVKDLCKKLQELYKLGITEIAVGGSVSKDDKSRSFLISWEENAKNEQR